MDCLLHRQSSSAASAKSFSETAVLSVPGVPGSCPARDPDERHGVPGACDRHGAAAVPIHNAISQFNNQSLEVNLDDNAK